ncbi:SUMF1/EgtB/PvdO family nonheme iron enzyme [Leucothrix pacifica]|nr:SUMF1/EgtB/PvdO family nonheme iron enzyme [Leucothrix pacifica]
MHDIFLSYSSQDRDRLTTLVDALEAQGWTVFWDHRAIKVADDWHKVIGTAIQQCTCVIVAWSENSVASTWVREEALIAKDRGVLYPIFIDQVPIPFGFTLLQAADFTRWNGDTNHQEFIGLKEQLSIRLNLQPVVNLKPEPNPPLMPEPTPEAIPTPKLKIVPTKKTEPKPRSPKQSSAQPQPQKVSATGSNSKTSESNVKLLGGVIALAAVGFGGYQLFSGGNNDARTSTASSPVTTAKPVAESVKQVVAVAEKPSAKLPENMPKMVLIPAGSFMMGCRDDKESGCQDDEKPAHTVNIKKFYLAETEVTVAQFRAFVDEKNYKTTAEQKGSCYSYDENGKWGDVKGNSWKKLGFEQGDNHPVACVSHDDATAYVKWLSDKTGKAWRLPSEAEWEYAARAGTETNYSWGKNIGSNNANCGANLCGDKFKYASPVASFSANEYGLFDMHGNVWEWVEDKWHKDYNGAPNDGSAWVSGNSSSRVLRGGSWSRGPQGLRSAIRFDYTPDYRSNALGFRPAQSYGE